jgi:hypothetical protein
MRGVKMKDKYGLHKDDLGYQVAFLGYQGNVCLSNAEIVKHLNGFNNTCDKLTEQIKSLTLDLGLSELATRSKLDLLNSCETALADRDVKIDKLTSENKMLREALESICRMNNYVDIDIAAREALEATKC